MTNVDIEMSETYMNMLKDSDDCYEATDEAAAKKFICLSGADDFRIELIKYIKRFTKDE